jgi:hypothetical protein
MRISRGLEESGPWVVLSVMITSLLVGCQQVEGDTDKGSASSGKAATSSAASIDEKSLGGLLAFGGMVNRAGMQLGLIVWNVSVTSIGYSTASLSWESPWENGKQFIIERSSDGTNFAQVTGLTGDKRSYLDAPVPYGSTLSYRVSAVSQADERILSRVVVVKTPSPVGTKRVFVSRDVFQANMVGIEGADYLCSVDPNKPEGGETWKALLSADANYNGNDIQRWACSTPFCSGGSNENRDWVLRPDTLYKRVSDGKPIGITNGSGILTFPLYNGFSTNCAGGLAWSGLKNDWRVINTGGPAGGWVYGGVSDCSFLNCALTDGTAIQDTSNGQSAMRSCVTTKNILCVEQ